MPGGIGMCGGQVVSVLDCQSRGSGLKSQSGQKFGSRFLLHLCPLTNSAMTSTMTTYCRWEVETVKERTGQPHSYALVMKMKSLTLHTQGCPRSSLWECSSSSNDLKMRILLITVRQKQRRSMTAIPHIRNAIE